MIKRLSMFVIAAIAVLSAAFVGQAFTNAKACEAGACADLFRTTMDEFLKDSHFDGEAVIEAKSSPVYDLELNPLGCVYDFTVNGEAGYAILLGGGDECEVAEFFFDARCPYGDGLAIYFANGIYLNYRDGKYYEALSGEELSDKELEIFKENEIFKGSGWTGSSEYVYYTTKVITDRLELAYHHPYYAGVPYITNACVPIAAGNIIVYYDRFFTNLIPEYEPGELYFDELYSYHVSDQEGYDAIYWLYNDMGTNSDGAGTSVSQFKSGFTKHVKRQGYTATYTSLGGGSSFNYTQAKSLLKSGQPLMLFTSSPFSVVSMMEYDDDDCDMLRTFTGDQAHAMAAFGYKDITYTLTSGKQRVDNYLQVATGYDISPRGYFNIRLYKPKEAYGILIS